MKNDRKSYKYTKIISYTVMKNICILIYFLYKNLKCEKMLKMASKATEYKEDFFQNISNSIIFTQNTARILSVIYCNILFEN